MHGQGLQEDLHYIHTSGNVQAPLALEFLDANHEDVQPVFAHSAAHVLGLVLESEYGDGLLLSDGPPVNKGKVYDARANVRTGPEILVAGANGEFFYEAALPGGRSIHESELEQLSRRARAIIKVSSCSVKPSIYDRLRVHV